MTASEYGNFRNQTLRDESRMWDSSCLLAFLWMAQWERPFFRVRLRFWMVYSPSWGMWQNRVHLVPESWKFGYEDVFLRCLFFFTLHTGIRAVMVIYLSFFKSSKRQLCQFCSVYRIHREIKQVNHYRQELSTVSPSMQLLVGLFLYCYSLSWTSSHTAAA